MLQRAQTPPLPFRTIGFLLLISLLHACSSRMAETSAPPPARVHVVPGEEPEPSPLAQLMREMTAFADSTRMRVAQNAPLLPFPEQFQQLRTAEATPGMKDPSFDPYAQAWLHHLNDLYNVPEAERPGVFNTLVQTCAGCHSTMCPGPLVKIKKLGLPE